MRCAPVRESRMFMRALHSRSPRGEQERGVLPEHVKCTPRIVSQAMKGRK
jgi:hypothetical protein